MNYLRNNLSRFKLITFDVTDTLLQYGVRPERHYAQVINSVLGPNIGLSLDEKAIASSFGSCFHSMKRQYPNYGYARKYTQEQNREENWRWWWRTLVERVILEAASKSTSDKIPPTLLTAIAEQLIDDYTFDTWRVCWKKCSGVDQFMRCLREPTTNGCSTEDRRKIIGVVSNFDSRLPIILRNNGISSMIDFITTSYDTGVEKPDPRIFEIALEQANLQSHSYEVQPHEALHIGNLYKEDYCGARSAGWHSMLVNVQETKKNQKMWTNIPSWHIFSGITELQARLENDPMFKW